MVFMVFTVVIFEFIKEVNEEIFLDYFDYIKVVKKCVIMSQSGGLN